MTGMQHGLGAATLLGVPAMSGLYRAQADAADPGAQACRATGPDLCRAAPPIPAPVVLTPAVWSVVQRPLIPVLGSDGPHHLAYIPRFLNLGSTAVSIQAVTPVDPAAGDAPSRADRVLDEAGRPVTGMVRPYPVSADPARPPYVAQLQPGQGGLVFLA